MKVGFYFDLKLSIHSQKADMDSKEFNCDVRAILLGLKRPFKKAFRSVR